MARIGLGIGVGRGGSRSWTPQYKALYDSLTEKPSGSVANAQNAFVKKAVDDGWWDKIACFIAYGFGMPNATDALLWVNNPARAAALVGGANVPAYSVGEGFVGNGTGYINTTFNLSTDGGGKFTQNDNTVIHGFSNHRITGALTSSGAFATNGVYLMPLYQSRMYLANNSTASNFIDTAGTGFIISRVRTGSTNYVWYKNKTLQATITANSAALKNLTAFSLATNTGSAVEMMSDTIDFELWGSSFTQDDINSFCDAWVALKEGLSTIKFHDSCAGQTIDTDKWLITNNNPANVQFEQNESIILHSAPIAGVASYFDNMITSKVSSVFGVFSLNALITHRVGIITYIQYGLYVDANNHISFYATDDNQIGFRIVRGGSTVYEAGAVLKDLAQIKIVVDRFHNVSAFKWANDAWVQLGATFNAPMGAKKVYMGSRGFTGSLGSINEVYITGKNRTTLYPESKTNIATDARTFGAVPNGITDNAASINSGLVSGDVLLQNGDFAIGSSILIPSNRTLYIKNAKVTLLDDSFDNVARNATPSTGNVDVNIIGMGNAVINGNAEGNDSVDYTIFGGISSDAENLYKANCLFIGNVVGFEFKNLFMLDYPAYGCTIQKSSDGVLHDFYFSRYHTTQNQDGVSVNCLTHDVEIYNLRGYTQDDVSSIFNSRTNYATLFYPFPNWNVGDVYNIDFHDYVVYLCDNPTHVFITGDGNKIHDINFDDIFVYQALAHVYMNMTAYVTTPPAATDFYNINIARNTVKALAAGYVGFRFQGDCKDVAITDWVNDSGKPDYVILSGDQSDNVTINGVQIT